VPGQCMVRMCETIVSAATQRLPTISLTKGDLQLLYESWGGPCRQGAQSCPSLLSSSLCAGLGVYVGGFHSDDIFFFFFIFFGGMWLKTQHLSRVQTHSCQAHCGLGTVFVPYLWDTIQKCKVTAGESDSGENGFDLRSSWFLPPE
jgi:hypothetical protein